MSNENKTVYDVAKEMRDSCAKFRDVIAARSFIATWANEVEGANKREIAAKDRQLEAASADAEEADAEIDSLRNKLAAKDAEIARWREKALHEGAVAEALRSENARLRVIVSDATVKEGNLREEIVRLRKLVEELAGVVSTARPKFCNGCPAVLCTIGGKLCGFVMHADELVEIARKVIGGAK